MAVGGNPDSGDLIQHIKDVGNMIARSAILPPPLPKYALTEQQAQLWHDTFPVSFKVNVAMGNIIIIVHPLVYKYDDLPS